jgi:hypothetical protein
MITKAWFYAAGIRALKTFAQSLVALLVISEAVTEVDWVQVLSVAALSAILSLLTSLTGLPELKTGSDGCLKIDTSDPNKDLYSLELNEDLSTLADKKTVTFIVKK